MLFGYLWLTVWRNCGAVGVQEEEWKCNSRIFNARWCSMCRVHPI